MTTFPALSAADQIAAMEARAETERTIYGQTTVPAMLRQGAAWGREVERLRDLFAEIKQWAGAYPVSVFPEPDFRRAHELLKAGGMSMDAVSASNMRHVLRGVIGIAGAALEGPK